MDPLALALSAATMGQALLAASVLGARGWRTPAHLPLALLLIASSIVAAGPLVAQLPPDWAVVWLLALLPACLLLGPMLWFYVEGLTAPSRWRPGVAHAWHLLPFGLGILAGMLLLTLPAPTRHAMLLDGVLVEEPWPLAVVLLVFLLILAWLVQSAVYLLRALGRLARYRRLLRQVFASTERIELRWLSGLVLVIGGVWLSTVAAVVADNFFGATLFGFRTGSAMALVLVWTLGLWGLRQRPGFEGMGATEHALVLEQVAAADAGRAKYQRSALGPEQASRIAEKARAGMADEQLYLDPTLSLTTLASAIGVSPNYLSQTLNEVVGESFFDYVNRWRIEAAKPRVAAGEETILAIAMDAGFNARSSFYKAFRRITGVTPGEYRRLHQGAAVATAAPAAGDQLARSATSRNP